MRDGKRFVLLFRELAGRERTLRFASCAAGRSLQPEYIGLLVAQLREYVNERPVFADATGYSGWNRERACGRDRLLLAYKRCVHVADRADYAPSDNGCDDHYLPNDAPPASLAEFEPPGFEDARTKVT